METTRKIIVAVDGYSSCGKSTLAKDLAKALHYLYIDTGAMYRAVTLFFMENNIFRGENEKISGALKKINIEFRKNHKSQLNETWLNGKNVEERIRQMDVAANVSWVSAVREVRTKLVDMQRQLGKQGGVVMDGRDIGTVVFPDARLKIFMTASLAVRAKRRFSELKGKAGHITLDKVKQNLQKRDHLDSTRDVAPLKQAADAILLDNSTMTREEQLKWAFEQAKRRV